MEEKIRCFICKFEFCADTTSTKIVCPRCGSGFERVMKKDAPVEKKEPVEDVVLEAVDDTVVEDSAVEDKPGRRGKRTKFSFDAVPSQDEPIDD